MRLGELTYHLGLWSNMIYVLFYTYCGDVRRLEDYGGNIEAFVIKHIKEHGYSFMALFSNKEWNTGFFRNQRIIDRAKEHTRIGLL